MPAPTRDAERRQETMVTAMCEHLSKDTLKALILNAIPAEQREWENGEPHRMIDPEYEAQFGDDTQHDYIELLDDIRRHVDPTHADPEAIRRIHLQVEDHFLPADGSSWQDCEPGPIFFRPVLIMFRKWCALWVATRPSGYDTSDSEGSSYASASSSRESSHEPRSPASSRPPSREHIRPSTTPSPRARPGPRGGAYRDVPHTPGLHGGAYRDVPHTPGRSPRSRSPIQRPGSARSTRSELPDLLHQMKMACISE